MQQGSSRFRVTLEAKRRGGGHDSWCAHPETRAGAVNGTPRWPTSSATGWFVNVTGME